MKYLRRINESDEDKVDQTVDTEDYFIDLMDFGFIKLVNLNNYKFKYKGKYDIDEILAIYQDILLKLKAFKGITKSLLSFREELVDIMFEIKEPIDGIEITIKGETVKLLPHSFTVNSQPRRGGIYYLKIDCKDFDNKTRNLTWTSERGGIINSEKVQRKCSTKTFSINLENATKLIELLRSDSLKQSNYSDYRVNINVLKPEHLVG